MFVLASRAFATPGWLARGDTTVEPRLSDKPLASFWGHSVLQDIPNHSCFDGSCVIMPGDGRPLMQWNKLSREKEDKVVDTTKA